MFERFTERARQVVVLAQEEARLLRHNYIGTEHILLGLLREEEGAAAGALGSLGVTLEYVRGQVTQIVGAGEEVTTGQIPFTPRAKRVLELALREALSLGHNHIGTEHILLGLVREDEGVAMRILVGLHLDAERVRNEVIRQLSDPSRGPSVEIVERPRAGTRTAVSLDGAWFTGLQGALRELQGAIERELGRLPDSADLLLALAAAPDTRAGAALREAGVDPGALAAAAATVRAAAGPTRAELVRQVETLRRDRERAAREQDYETAARLRDDERALAARMGDARASPETLAAMRDALGLAAADTSAGD
ncbi:MAG TPA: Clp protease N-terminal domain-containing protein [Solirubrobacteraceae bacterium]|nr:Clp protease N-terminal domain-containing protein [Solirubrobacteraceae bacterium]